ncbi:MAG: tail fiber protein [Pedobacter sp.]|nr:tail fiber protein [Pedobacter sp.]MDQ7950164.1 tail fiber protein [Cellulomonas sp.]MDQ8051445.1 tail fiber protein [Pedobacter sp.]
MKKILLKTAVLILLACTNSDIAFSQTETVIPPSNRSTASLEKNILFFADKRFMVTQSGSISLPLVNLFDGNMQPNYSSAVNPSDPYVILIEGLPNIHSQAGGWIGWSTRGYPPYKFKVEAYNIYAGANTWVTIADETSFPGYSIMIPIPGLSVGKIRFTFYNGGGPNNEIGISELFYIHPEAAVAYDELMVKYSSDGKVGIGTDNPLTKLHVNGVVRWGDANAYSYSGEDSNGGYLEHVGVSNATSTLRFQTVKPSTSQYSVFRSNPYDGFSFTSNGGGNANVGIGVTNPGAPLHVSGGLPMTGSWNQTSILQATYPVQLFNSNNNRFAGIGYDYSSGMAIWVNSTTADVSGSGTPALSIRNDGKIGMGTYSPDEKLTVNGKIHAKEIRVDATGLPDYVFEADYQLPSLRETEAFIKKNKHLPEVPSAATVEKNGLELGEMNKILLKKIEELTLHLIDKEKKMQLSERKNRELEARLAKLERMMERR